MPFNTQYTQSKSDIQNIQSRPFLKYIKWFLIIIGIIILLFLILLILRLIGGVFIKEITQEVSVKTYEDKDAVASLNKEAPFFELPDLAGNKIKLSDFLGSPLVITFWTTWNSASADQIKIFDDFLSKNKSLPAGEAGILFKILTINSQEDKSAVSNFIKRGGYQLNVLLDEKGAISEIYRARNLPITYFLDKNGAIKDIFMGVLNEKMLVDRSEMIIR
ncbi:MAG: TlpA family protein disulfide reductase [Candidatus Portnoybacteria bacterium]|nr:TlpA family protein disulfide reductase [Candidatus Portnoybacteria bacterium]